MDRDTETPTFDAGGRTAGSDRSRSGRPIARWGGEPRESAGVREIASARPAAARDRLFRRLLGGADMLAAALALVAVVGVRDLRPAAVLMPVLLLVTHKVVGLYDRDDAVMRRSTLAEVPRLVEISGLLALLTWLFAREFVQRDLDRPDVLLLWLLVFAMTASFRAAARTLGRRCSPAERCAIVGDAAAIQRIEHKLGHSRINASIVATLKLSQAGQSVAPSSERLFIRWLEEHAVERLVLAPIASGPAASLDHLRVAKAAGVRVSLLPRLFEAIGSSVEFEDVDGMTVLGIKTFGLSRSSRLLKRAFDLAGATAGLIAVAPAMVTFAVLVKLTSRGPVFFRQDRVGRDGEHFRMIKFRSMVDGADAMKDQLRVGLSSDDLFKLENDPRVTRIGKLLRATSLDELPQLFNVLKGEMSLVGPRPLVIEEDALVSGIDRSRLHLTPGMTGPWQILGSARVPLREMVSMDYLYVANWTLWRDVEILIRTATHVLRRGGM